MLSNMFDQAFSLIFGVCLRFIRQEEGAEVSQNRIIVVRISSRLRKIFRYCVTTYVHK